MGGRGLCRRLDGWTLDRERDGPQVGRGWRGREARWVRVRLQVLGKGPQCYAQPEVRRYLLWKRNMPWAALQGFSSYPKQMLGPEAPGQGSQATPDQATEKTSTFGSLLAIQKDSGQQRRVQLCRPDRQLRMESSMASPVGASSGQPPSPPQAEVAISSPPLGVCCHDSLLPAGPFLSRNPLSLQHLCTADTPLADGTPPCLSAETGRLLSPVSMRGTKQKSAHVLCARPLP